MKTYVYIAITIIFCLMPNMVGAKTTTKAPIKLFYYVDNINAYNSLKANAKGIDILAPQSYNVDEFGILKGKIPDRVMGVVNKYHIKLMPLVVNKKFSQDGMHSLLTSDVAQNAAILNMISEALIHKYIGWQFDFEHIASTDKELYASFVERAGKEFHKSKLQFSVAIAAIDENSYKEYPELSWLNWSGAFDYARIGAASDFVSIMTYDQPFSPGPTATLPWMENIMRYATTQIPASKISLGIPAYTWHWHDGTNEFVGTGGYKKIGDRLKEKRYTEIGYSEELGTPWMRYEKDNVLYKAWYENSKSFVTKTALVKKYKLHGYSMWVLGLEDPKIWTNVPKKK